MIDKRVVENVLEAALATGGDYSELFAEDTEKSLISMTDGKVEDASYRRVNGAGVRVLLGARCVYAYTSGQDEKALMEAAQAAAAALKGTRDHETRAFGVRRVGEYSPKEPYAQVDNAARIALIRRASDAAKAYSGEITQVLARFLDVDQRMMVANSLGVWAEDRRPRGRVVVQAVAMKDGEAQTGYKAPGRGEGFEQFRNYDMEALGTTAAKQAVTMLHAPQCPAAGAVPVVIDGGFGGVILHEACVHSLEATSVAKGNSEFCGKLGQTVASPIVTAVDDGTMPGEWGSIRFDDEGTPAQRNVLIENGVLKSYLVDYRNTRLMEHPLTGSSRRESYEFAPTSRMTNTFFAEGMDDDEEMIRTMGTGLYAASMGGGSVNPLTGEFNFAVDEAYWVKDGKIFCPVRGATLIGKGADVIKKIDRIGRHMWMAPGMCGSLSGSVPTNVGQPRIRVTDIVVGGKGGAL
ncbi:MAG TPA: TldD/PmbA family protein [Clostridia bacterium]|nr:TldD/PmbA family protein [Clostridia bacterium]